MSNLGDYFNAPPVPSRKTITYQRKPQVPRLIEYIAWLIVTVSASAVVLFFVLMVILLVGSPFVRA